MTKCASLGDSSVAESKLSEAEALLQKDILSSASQRTACSQFLSGIPRLSQHYPGIDDTVALALRHNLHWIEVQLGNLG